MVDCFVWSTSCYKGTNKVLQENAGKTDNNEGTIGTYKCIVNASPILFRDNPWCFGKKEKTTSSMIGSLLEAYHLWDDLSITEKKFLYSFHGCNEGVHGIQDFLSTVENCLDCPKPIMPMHFINIDTGLFVRLMEVHENWLTLFYGEDALEKLIEACERLIHECWTSATFANVTKSYYGKEFKKSLEYCGETFILLQEFAAGLAWIMGSSHTVESNDSILKQTKSDQRMCLSNYALEGQMQCKQHKQLVHLCYDLI